MKIMSWVEWNSTLLDFIDSTICRKGNWLSPKINETTSIYASNCFNCLSWENLPDADYSILTICEDPRSRTCWLKNSSSSPACDIFEPFIKTKN